MATLFEVLQFLDDAGNPISLGRIYWYEAGTSTPKLTWKDAAETAVHTNPIILDGDGRPPGGAIFIRGSYKLIIKNEDDSITYQTIDNINEYNQYDFTGITATVADLNSTTTTAKLIGGVPPLVYTVLLDDRGKTLMVNSLTSAATIYLPASSSLGDTFKVWIKKTDRSLNTVTIIPAGIETIDGAANLTLYDYNDFVELHSDGSNWYVGGVLIRGTIASINTATTITLADNGKTYNCNAGSGSFDITLPSCSVVGRGFHVAFKKTDSSANSIDLVPNGSETIDGAAKYFIHAQWQYTSIKSNGSNWFVMSESGSSDHYVTGDVKPTYNQSQNGWVVMNDGTIGSASSGATTRANADTQDLYVLLWNTVSNTYCPVTGGRGANALADFNANKSMRLPLALGRSMIQAGISGLGNTYAIGQNYGEELHPLSIPELAAHTHTYLETMLVGYPYWEIKWEADHHLAPVTQSTGSTGSSVGHNTVHPVCAMFYLIKL